MTTLSHNKLRILVTGGAGFLGSHLCERLLAEENDVICVDNFFTGRRENVSHLLDNRRFELLRHDVIEPILLEVDQIYNLACPASPIHYQYNPVKTVKTSVMGNDQYAGSGQARPGTYPPSLDFRGLWKSASASATRRVLGQC